MTERRWDPVTGEWRTFATHGQDRTFLPPAEACPLCPTPVGATTTTEVPEPTYQIVVFDNQFPSLSANPPDPTVQSSDLYGVVPAVGAAEGGLYSVLPNAPCTG